MQKRLWLFVVWIALPSSVLAQDGSHWGIAASVVPSWTVPSRFATLFNAQDVDLKSTDFSIGIARGRTLGGDWSVSYIHKKFAQGSSASDLSTDCQSFTNGCFQDGTVRVVRDATLSGVEMVKFIPFGTIKRRVQIGLVVGGGIGTLSGTLDEHQFSGEFVRFTNTAVIGRQTETVTTVPARDLFGISHVPLAKVEGMVGVIVAPGVKVRVSGGLDFPGSTSFALSGVYLIGAK
jgi:hypothetical protein